MAEYASNSELDFWTESVRDETKLRIQFKHERLFKSRV